MLAATFLAVLGVSFACQWANRRLRRHFVHTVGTYKVWRVANLGVSLAHSCIAASWAVFVFLHFPALFVDMELWSLNGCCLVCFLLLFFQLFVWLRYY